MADAYTSILLYPRLQFDVPYSDTVRRRNNEITIQRVSASLRTIPESSILKPIAVAIGPYHHGSTQRLKEMEAAKKEALDAFLLVAGTSREAVEQEIASLAKDARKCYAEDEKIQELFRRQRDESPRQRPGLGVPRRGWEQQRRPGMEMYDDEGNWVPAGDWRRRGASLSDDSYPPQHSVYEQEYRYVPYNRRDEGVVDDNGADSRVDDDMVEPRSVDEVGGDEQGIDEVGGAGAMVLYQGVGDEQGVDEVGGYGAGAMVLYQGVGDEQGVDGVGGEGNDNVQDNLDYSRFVDMMLLDGCFLLQFMVSMCNDPNARPEDDPFMSMAEVHTCIDYIMKDILLLENQIPWMVLKALTRMRPATAPPVPVDKFLALMASTFLVQKDTSPAPQDQLGGAEATSHDNQPAHLLALFHRHLVGPPRAQDNRHPRVPCLSTTAAGLAEMGVDLTASAGKANRFGDVASMSKRRRWGLFGELSLAPLVLNELTECWLINMAAYEAWLGPTQADNFAVSSYVSLLALLVNREEDVQVLRAKGIINSAWSDDSTLAFFNRTAPHLHLGHRYYHIFRLLQEYRDERWVWIEIHRIFYRYYKTIIAWASAISVIVGLFKVILSLKQPRG